MSQLNATRLCDLIDPRPDPVLVWLDTPDPSDEELGTSESPSSGPSRVELSGPVARRWVAKTDNFLASELPYGGSRFVTLLPPHWRSPFWLIGAWLRGMTLVPAWAGANADLVVANDVDVLEAIRDEGGPDALVAQTQDSLALAWPGTLPPEILDGTADVMSFGDWVDSPMTAPADTNLVSKDIDWLPPEVWKHPEELSMPLRSLYGLDYVGKVIDEDGAPLRDPRLLDGARVLVCTDNLVLFSAQLIQLWMAGARVIWAPGLKRAPGDPTTSVPSGDPLLLERIQAERFDYRLAN